MVSVVRVLIVPSGIETNSYDHERKHLEGINCT